LEVFFGLQIFFFDKNFLNRIKNVGQVQERIDLETL
jgi:hypothetical protein